MSRINIIELCTVLLILSASYVSSFPITHHHQSYPRTTISLHSTKDNDAPYREAAYNPTAASAFYQNRQLQSLSRLSQILTKSVGFLTSTAIDAKLNKEDEMADKRSEELLELISDLGPTFIKIGQALSTRTDLLPAKYAQGLTKLQDAVPPFSAQLGREVIESELGIKIEDVFSSLSLQPVASASIGQVYKGTLRDSGQEVAVKVQRPQVLQNVALDLHLMRSIAPKWQEYKEMNTNLVGLIDAWGMGFINELDYRKEAQAQTEFSEAMKERGLGSVFAPEVVPALSSTHVLTTKWVDGERLIDSDSGDVPRLCGVALNAYLTMMLDTGKLHCDPHPGNLLRESSTGRLCILDWGMTLDVPADLQLSLLEFIANLNSDNYEDIPQDLVKLKFVPEDKLDELRQSGLTVAIRNILKLTAEGGGPKGAMQRMVAQNKEKYAEALKGYDDLDSPEATAERQRLFREDWQRQMAEDSLSRGESPQSSTTMDLTTKIEQLQETNSDVFAIPDYFVYMSRAFATLEGIGLSSDPNYSITKECFPYLAKRLVSDDSARARGALKMLLYGKNNVLDLTKLQEVTNGFERYTTSTSSVESSRGMSDEGRNTAIEQIANVLLNEDSNYVQELLLRESAMALDATIRNSLLSPFEQVRNLPFLQFSSALPQPFTLPLELAKLTFDLQELDEKDHKRLDNVRILADLLNSGDNNGNQRIDGSSSSMNGRKIIQEAFERRQALTRIGLRFSGSLVNVQADRLRERTETSELAKVFALRGADTCDAVAKIIADLDITLSTTR